jgi:aerobic-type carbon monoxide dehydrogenase small subunit (CoxS/CutS family)
MKQTINVTINGRVYEEDVEPRLLLSHFLRENLGLTGTHVACVVGEYGKLVKMRGSPRSLHDAGNNRFTR